MINRLFKGGVTLIACLVFLVGCTQDKPNEVGYLRHVGDTKFDPLVDDANFEVCHEDLALQYYNFSSAIQYEGEKYAILEVFDESYTMDHLPGEDGFITIRFIVNCKGVSGWFRMEEVDMDYHPKEFDSRIVDLLLSTTKSLDGWKTGAYDDRVYDYYQYLIFKMKDGQIAQIMP